MMYVCQACKGETYSRSNKMKPSTCTDCIVDNPITPNTILTCACHEVGHDQTKIPEIKPMSKSLESELEALLGEEEIKVNWSKNE